MHFRTLLTASICSFFLVTPCLAQLPPKPPAAPASQAPPPAKPLKEEDAAKLLAQLAEMTKSHEEHKYGRNAQVIRELRDAGASGDKAFALWLDCMKDVEFDQKGKNATAFADWKRDQTKNSDKERDAALQLQVQWLAIVLMHANARNEAARHEAVNAAVMFLDTVVDRIQKADGQLNGRAGENVMNSVFAKHFKLETSVTLRDGVAYVPGDVDGIYDKMILPYYRNAQLANSLMQAWSKRIEQQTAIAASFKFIEAREKFTAEKLPELKWGQARELYQLGQEETSAQQMLALLRANLAHRNATQWMAELTALIKKEDLPVPSEEKPSPGGSAPQERGPRAGGIPGRLRKE